MSSQRHKLWEQGATSAGEIHAQGVVAPGIAMQVDPEALNVLKGGPALFNTGLEWKEEPVDGGVEVPVGAYGGPLQGSTLTGAIPEELVPPDPTPDGEAPTLISIDPNTGQIGQSDITATITGTGFTNESILVWNGADDHADYVNETTLTTVVKVELATVPSVCTVAVRNGDALSNELTFEITEAAPETPDEEERTLPVTFNIAEVRYDDQLGQMIFHLEDAASGTVRTGDHILVEATGNTGVNGTYTAENVAGPEFAVTRDNALTAVITDKGRATITGGGA